MDMRKLALFCILVVSLASFFVYTQELVAQTTAIVPVATKINGLTAVNVTPAAGQDQNTFSCDQPLKFKISIKVGNENWLKDDFYQGKYHAIRKISIYRDDVPKPPIPPGGIDLGPDPIVTKDLSNMTPMAPVTIEIPSQVKISDGKSPVIFRAVFYGGWMVVPDLPLPGNASKPSQGEIASTYSKLTTNATECAYKRNVTGIPMQSPIKPLGGKESGGKKTPPGEIKAFNPQPEPPKSDATKKPGGKPVPPNTPKPPKP
jgi:hypothetical protein